MESRPSQAERQLRLGWPCMLLSFQLLLEQNKPESEY
jgi:hypothetical protein